MSAFYLAFTNGWFFKERDDLKMGVEKMDMIFGIDLVDLITIIIASVAIVISIPAFLVSRRSLHHQALLDIHKDYRSPEMLSALDGIWKFYINFRKNHPNLKIDSKDFKEGLKAEYKNIRKKQNKSIANRKLNVEESLNYKRRLVTHFYIHLASIHKHKILPDKMIFDWWTPSDFKTFEIIMTLEKAMLETSEINPENARFAFEPLLELEADCKLYFDKNKESVLSKYNSYENSKNF